MSRAHVQYKERDLSSYVQSGQTIYVGFIIPAVKGKRMKVLNFSSTQDFLKRLTPNGKIEVGMDLSYFSALKVLESTGNLAVVVPRAKNCKKAGLKLYRTTQPVALEEKQGIEGDTQAFKFEENQSCVISAASEGVWGNDIYVTVHSFKDTEQVDISEISSSTELKLDLKQTWGNGFPVKVFAKELPEELDAYETYFVRKGTDGKYTLHATQEKALDGTSSGITVASMKAGKLSVDPATRQTRLEGTSCIRVFHKSNLNDPIESYIVSRDETARDLDGRNIFIEEVVKTSETIEIANNPLVSEKEMLQDIVTPVRLGGGDNGDAVTTGDMIRALRLFDNENEYPLTLIGDGGWTQPAYQQKLLDLCKKRGDCFAVLSAPYELQANPSTSAQDVVNYRRYELNVSSSWGGLYAPHVKIYDEWNDRTVWASPDGVALKAILDTASNFEIFYPVAGEQRGIVSVLDTKVHYTDPDQDLLYDNDVNPIIFDVGTGIKIWGQKTLLGKPSKLDRIHVRLLLITIAPAIRKMLKGVLFEFNDEITRAIVRARITTFMESIQARRGITSFKVVCDETNNTAQDLVNNKMNVGLAICPNASVEFIDFTIGITNELTSVELATQALR